MKKLLCFVLCLCLFVPFLPGCKLGTLSDEEAKAELERLLPEAKALMEVFYGEGLSYEPLPEDSTDYYAYVTQDAPYQSINALKAAAEKVFSAEYLPTLYEYAFDGSEYYAARYFMAKDNRLKINLKLEPMALYRDIDISTAKVVEGTPAKAVISLKATNAKGVKKDKTITIVRQDDGLWYLDCGAY